MTYIKLASGGVKRHHLVVAGPPSAEFVTLYGCVVTQPQSWKLIGRLEGDECERCADLAFSGTAHPREAKQNPVAKYVNRR